MKGSLLMGALLIAITAPLGAEPSARVLLSEEAQADWSGVGRLNMGGIGHCTATLVGRSDLVVTAAHCLYVAATGARFHPEKLHFLPGYRMGAYAAYLRGGEVSVAPGFVFTPRRGDPTHDLALIRLAEPASRTIRPLALATHPATVGDVVVVLSYGRDRPEALSAQTGCTVTARRGPLLLTDCEAVPGVSGAPIIRHGHDGPELVAVVSAIADPDRSGRGRAIGVALDAHLRTLARPIAP